MIVKSDVTHLKMIAKSNITYDSEKCHHERKKCHKMPPHLKIGCISEEAHDIIYLRVGISWLRSDTYHWAVSLEAAFYTADFLVTDFTSFLSRRFFPSFTSMNFSRMSLLISTFLPTLRTGRKMGVATSTIVCYEAGTIDNTKKLVLEGLSEALHVSVEWLKGETEEYETDITDKREISFVCLREDGCLELPATVETACRTAARKVPELEGFHFHTLRHTYTTNLLSNGAQPKDVQELLGHSDVSTTMNVYAHATREAKRESAKLLDKVVGMN